MLDSFRQFHSRWFESVDADILGDEHASVFRDVFDQRWALRRNGMWYVGEPARAEMPDQGWKLHISVPTRATTEALRRVFPVLRDEGDPPPYALGGTCAIRCRRGRMAAIISASRYSDSVRRSAATREERS